MPRKRARMQYASVSEDENDNGTHADAENVDASFEDASDTENGFGASNSNSSLSSAVRDEIIAETIKLALACEESKIFLKRTMICNDVISSRAVGHRPMTVYRELFPDIQRKLQDKFGMQLVAVPESHIPSAMRPVKAGKHSDEQGYDQDQQVIAGLPDPMKCDSLMLSSTLPIEYRKVVAHPRPAYERSFMGSAFVIITLVILNGGWVKKSQLVTDFLSKIGLKDIVGGESIESLLSKMKDRRYLVSRKIQQSEEDLQQEFFCLGQRALKEFTIDGLGYMFEKLYGGDDFNAESYTETIGKLKDAPLRHISEFVPPEYLSARSNEEQATST